MGCGCNQVRSKGVDRVGHRSLAASAARVWTVEYPDGRTEDHPNLLAAKRAARQGGGRLR